MIDTTIRRRTLAAVVAIAGLLAAISIIAFLPGRGGRNRIRIMDPVEANNLHVPLAERLGYFAAEGLSVDISGTSAGKLAMDALNARAVEYAVVVEMNIAHTLFNHDDIAILAEIAQPTRAIKLLGRRDRGVSGVDDLRGKKIGVLLGVNIHLFLVRFLEDRGIPLSSVELVNLRPPDAAAAFEAGDLDAVITWQPHVQRLQQRLGAKVVVLTDESERYWTYKMVLATRRSYLEDHGDEATRVLRAMLQADDAIRRDPERAKTVLAELLHTDRAAVNGFFGEIHFEVRITPRLLEMLRVEVDWLQSNLLKGRKPVTSDHRRLVSDLLRTLRPSAFQLAD